MELSMKVIYMEITGSKAVALMYIPFFTHFHSSFVSDLQVAGTDSEPTKPSSVRILGARHASFCF